MFNIATYLDKFKNIGLKEQLFKESVIKILEIHLKKTIESKDILFKSNMITLKVSPMIRNELLIKKTAILKEIVASNPQFIVKDIR